MNELALSSRRGDLDAADACLFGLSLCAGAGGIDLGLTIAIPPSHGLQANHCRAAGYRTVCYVEREAYAAATLVARMEDAALDRAPVWDDITTFDGRPWRGAVDILTGGYPCQPFSVAGKRKGTDDPRHLWPHFARVISECQPEWVFLENVANHINLGYREVRCELEELGYGVTEGLFTAAEVGAPHKRQRLFILGGAAQQRMTPAMAFAAAPRMHGGGWAGLRPDEVPAILQRGERVLSRREVAQSVQGQVAVGPEARTTTVVRIDLSPDLEARLLRQSKSHAVEITRDGIRQYDRLALPARVSQIAADPGVTG